MPQPLNNHAFVALGSNLGDSAIILARAFQKLETLSAVPLLHSSVWQTSPVDCPPGSPLFLNAVAGLFPIPGETPESLLAKLQSLEIEFGRKPRQALNEARSLDLDLISFASQIRQTANLVIPHPRAHLRRFVLQPLAEIAPQLVLPGQQKAVQELLRDLVSPETITRLDSFARRSRAQRLQSE